MLESWPAAIFHIDGDAFFASCEQAIHPELKGKPVVTGQERNIVASLSYEAKALGVKRATPLWEARKLCPGLIVLPSDYETYSLISKRMFAILRRFTPVVEESSIDEGFGDLEGLRRIYRTGYEGIARQIRETVEKELDIPVSAGLSLTKTLAKMASKFKKPRGFTAVPGYRLHQFLKQIPVSEVTGIGPNTTALLAKKGVRTALDYVKRPEGWIRALLGKTGIELWHELRGEKVYALNCEEKSSYASVTKSKTFMPPSQDPEYVKAQLFRNTESAFIKLRRYRLAARKFAVFLRRQDFRSVGAEGALNRPTSSPFELFPHLKEIFSEIFRPGTWYRQTAIVLTHLSADREAQLELFDDPVRMIRMKKLSQTIDEINHEYGKHTVFSGQGLHLKIRDRQDNGPLPQTIPQARRDPSGRKCLSQRPCAGTANQSRNLRFRSQLSQHPCAGTANQSRNLRFRSQLSQRLCAGTANQSRNLRFRSQLSQRKMLLLPGETPRQRLAIPIVRIRV